MKKAKLKLGLLALCLALLMAGCAAPASAAPGPAASPARDTADMPGEESSFSVHFIDVGQADAALVECDGHFMLVDGGNRGDSDVIYTVLKKAGADKLDMVVASHAHEDHIGGLPGAFSYATAELTLCPVTDYDSDIFRTFKEYAEEKGGGLTVPEAGDMYDLGSAEVEILGLNAGEDTNNTSIVLMIRYGETSFLFTGDAEREAEQALLDSGAELKADVLKVGHHGSDTSTSYPFLREVMPEYAVISVGEGNSYEHPEEGPLSRLRDAGCKILRSDLNGDIIISSDGKKLSITTDKTATEEQLLTPGGKTQSIAKPAAAESPRPSPEETEQSQTQETMVWIPKSGSKYHSDPECSNMKDPSQVSLSQAESLGYTPCKKCW
ncbi:MAG TPA: MBL fold metallo-hydrolase [Candidatus Limivicinus faecipullorum]|nr:MBL fold metallo-hydrolase [Candidatus Limivicinus faecipullorum]